MHRTSVLALALAAVLLLGLAAPSLAVYNCTGVNSLSNFVLCETEGQCCGQGTMSPSCVTDPNKQCCRWYLASTQCGKTERCCGALGYGASSDAFCCGNATTTCCQTTADGMSACCADGAVCCSGFNSFCCEAGSQCDTLNYKCIPPTKKRLD